MPAFRLVLVTVMQVSNPAIRYQQYLKTKPMSDTSIPDEVIVDCWARKSAPQKWEYCLLSVPNTKELNALGEQGWELTAVGAYGVAYFKRPKP